MEKDFGFWFHPRNTDWKSPNLNSSGSLNLGQQNTGPDHMNPYTNMVSTNGTLPVFAFSGVPDGKASLPNEPRGWFYCLPRFRQAFAPVPNCVAREKLPAGLKENCQEAGALIAGSACGQKRYLVFDQAGDKTTLLFSSGIGAPVQYLPSWTAKPPGAFDFNKEEEGTKRDSIYPSGTSFNNEENRKGYEQSEMHEDTEEINALLYSDDDNDCSEDDEVTSTGHSPGSVTVHARQEWFEESGEEVASSAGPTKRQKLFDGGYDVPSLMDTASSVKINSCFESEDDAESSCGDVQNRGFGELGSFSGNKRSRKEKIRKTVSILESIIPGGKGKDASVVLDEAIHYLRSLKVKAKALGLDNL